MPDQKMQQMNPKKYIKSLPRGGIECGICYGTLNEGPEPEAGVVLTCGHIFGERCIGKWFDMENQPYGSCPLCRQRLFKHTPARRIWNMNWVFIFVASMIVWHLQMAMRLMIERKGVAQARPGRDFDAVVVLIMIKEYLYPTV